MQKCHHATNREEGLVKRANNPKSVLLTLKKPTPMMEDYENHLVGSNKKDWISFVQKKQKIFYFLKSEWNMKIL